MFSHNTLEEEAKLAAVQRVWQSRRSTSALFEQPDETAELLSPCVSISLLAQPFYHISTFHYPLQFHIISFLS